MIIKKSPAEIDKMALTGAVLARDDGHRSPPRSAPASAPPSSTELAERVDPPDSGAVLTFKGYRGFPGSICASPTP